MIKSLNRDNPEKSIFITFDLQYLNEHDSICHFLDNIYGDKTKVTAYYFSF